MDNVVNLMIYEYNIKKLNMDFMGYQLQPNDIYTFHHLIIPNRHGGPRERWNGAILCGKTSHPYLHTIERKDNEIFYLITSEMIDINIKGFLDIENIKRIDKLLSYFEYKYNGSKTTKGKDLIREQYKTRILRG